MRKKNFLKKVGKSFLFAKQWLKKVFKENNFSLKKVFMRKK
jgi:hypothetical protein